MPNCSDTKYKCGVACTVSVNNAWYKDCATGHVGTGATYALARTAANKKVPPVKISPNLKFLGTGSGGAGAQGRLNATLKPPLRVRGSGSATPGARPISAARPITPRRITGTGRIGVGPTGSVRTPPIDLRAQPVSTTITEPISTIQDQVANTGMGTWIIIGLAVVVLIMVIK